MPINTLEQVKQADCLECILELSIYWDEKGFIETIRTPGGKRLFNVTKFQREKKVLPEGHETETIENTNVPLPERFSIVYIRVSSAAQKPDLERQRSYMTKRYPNHIVIEDIGSGMNLNKRGLRKILKWAISGKVEEVVIAYKDRLARFGFELIEDLIKEYSGGRIVILNNPIEKSPEDELVMDMLQIMNIFVAKMNGMRKYANHEENL